MGKIRKDLVDAVMNNPTSPIAGAVRQATKLFLAIQKLHGTETACAIFNMFAEPDTPTWLKRCRDERYLNRLGYRSYYVGDLLKPPEPPVTPATTVYALAREVAAETGQSVETVERSLYRLVAEHKANQAAPWTDEPDEPEDP